MIISRKKPNKGATGFRIDQAEKFISCDLSWWRGQVEPE
jgi:hypothetical protein